MTWRSLICWWESKRMTRNGNRLTKNSLTSMVPRVTWLNMESLKTASEHLRCILILFYGTNKSLPQAIYRGTNILFSAILSHLILLLSFAFPDCLISIVARVQNKMASETKFPSLKISWIPFRVPSFVQSLIWMLVASKRIRRGQHRINLSF